MTVVPLPACLSFFLSVQSELPPAGHQGHAPKPCPRSLYELQLTQVSVQKPELYASCQHT